MSAINPALPGSQRRCDTCLGSSAQRLRWLTECADEGAAHALGIAKSCTGGGVTAGIDFALTVAAELAGPEVAKPIQLQIEYAPAPPFDAGSPEAAPPSVVSQLRDRNAALTDQRRQIVKAAAERMVVS